LPSASCKEILIAPLDWGMGHTTRCIPIIAHMLSQGHHITFAGNEWQCHFINKTFTHIETINLEGYNVSYSKRGSGFLFSILLQVPGLLKTIAAEHNWLLQRAADKKYDLIISDNRYGLWHPEIPSVILTHQLELITGMGNGTDRLFQQLHYKYLGRFKEIWVPDTASYMNLSGRLGHPKKLPPLTKYIGPLSQFYTNQTEERINESTNQLLVLLSGPEPQRTLLSVMLWEQVKTYTGKVVFVEGSNAIDARTDIPEHVRYYKQLNRADLLPLLQEAAVVICRSGYSSIMDLVALNKKAILIPTSGQTEQEYLASYLQEAGMFYSMKQKDFDLQKVLGIIQTFPFKQFTSDDAFASYKNVLNAVL